MPVNAARFDHLAHPCPIVRLRQKCPLMHRKSAPVAYHRLVRQLHAADNTGLHTHPLPNDCFLISQYINYTNCNIRNATVFFLIGRIVPLVFSSSKTHKKKQPAENSCRLSLFGINSPPTHRCPPRCRRSRPLYRRHPRPRYPIQSIPRSRADPPDYPTAYRR